jgi:hypothetical protein
VIYRSRTNSTLLSYGADINIKNKTGELPLHLLVAQLLPGNDEHLKVLLNFLEHNPDVSMPMSNGSILFEAVLGKLSHNLARVREERYQHGMSVDLIELERQCLGRFLSLGADPNTVVTEGRPLLHHCLGRGYLHEALRQRLAHAYLPTS